MHALKTSGGGGIRLVKVRVDENGGVLGSRKCRQRGHRLLCLLHCRKVRALQCSTSASSSSRGQQVGTLHEQSRWMCSLPIYTLFLQVGDGRKLGRYIQEEQDGCEDDDEAIGQFPRMRRADEPGLGRGQQLGVHLLHGVLGDADLKEAKPAALWELVHNLIDCIDEPGPAQLPGAKGGTALFCSPLGVSLSSASVDFLATFNFHMPQKV